MSAALSALLALTPLDEAATAALVERIGMKGFLILGGGALLVYLAVSGKAEPVLKGLFGK